MNQFIHFCGYSVSEELKQLISSLRQMSTGLEDLSALPQPTNQKLPVYELNYGSNTGARHCIQDLRRVVGGTNEWKQNLRLHPSRKEVEGTTGKLFCGTSSRKRWRSGERACAAMLLAAELQGDPVGMLRITGSSRVLIPTEERFWGRGESTSLLGMYSI